MNERVNPFKKLQKPGKHVKRIVIGAAGLVIIAGLAGDATYQIQEQEQAVLTTFGVPKAVAETGLHFKIPFIQKVQKVNTTIQGFPIGYSMGDNSVVENEGIMITSDYNFIDVDFFVEYRILEPVKYLYNSEEPEDILKNICLTIKPGEKLAIVGLNGAGKTTCLKMISGLSKPTCGEIEMFGYKGKDLQKVRSRIGCLIEAPGLYGNMTAYENLNIKCKLFGIKKKSYIEEILRIIGLEDVGKKKTKHFSLGMKQRLGIGLALVGEPDLLVLDEPINGLDPQGIAEIRDTIQRLQKEKNMTICISSHILEELSKIATDYGIIHNGSLLQEITREELIRRCSERIELTLDHPKQAIPVMDSMGFTNYQVTDKEHIHIFERLNESAALNMELAKSGIPVKGISITSEELETYFLNLTGGADHA